MPALNVPNAITLSRLVLVVPFAILLFTEKPRWTLVVVFVLAAATDWFDGFFARRLGQVTSRGAWLDQIVDRAFTIAVVLLLLVHGGTSSGAVARGSDDGLALPLLLALACAREIVALPGAVVVLVRGLSLHHVEPVGKVATFVQSMTLAAILLELSWAPWLAVACAVVGIAAGASYLRYSLRPLRPGAASR